MRRSVALLGSSACPVLAGAGFLLADHGANGQEAAVTVGLSANSSSSSALVPEVFGQSLASAEQAMNGAGLKYTIKQSHLPGPPGVVVQQSPLERLFHAAQS